MLVFKDIDEAIEEIKIMKAEKEKMLEDQAKKEQAIKDKMKIAQKKYAQSNKGKEARKRTYKKNYKPTGNPRGRPKKNSNL